MVIPARASTFAVAGMGPVSMSTGSSPTTDDATDAGPRAQAERGGAFRAHDQQRAGAVGDLRGVAGGDLPVDRREALVHLLGAEGGLQRCQLLDGGAGADRLVDGDDGALRGGHRARSRRRSRRRPRWPRPARASARRTRRAAAAARPHLSATSSAETPCGTRSGNRARTPGPCGSAPMRGRAHRHAAHRFHARGDDDVVGAGDDALRRRTRAACWPEPHLRSMVTDGTCTG